MAKKVVFLSFAVLLLLSACGYSGSYEEGYSSGYSAGYDRGYEAGRAIASSNVETAPPASTAPPVSAVQPESPLAPSLAQTTPSPAPRESSYTTYYTPKATPTPRPTQAPARASADTSMTVYITNTGSKYHRGNCSYLNQSKIPISLNAAKAQGYTPCSRCW